MTTGVRHEHSRNRTQAAKSSTASTTRSKRME